MAVVVGILAALACHTLPAGDPKRPDVVLISIDSLRPDHLSSYGHKRDTSPTIDALAEDGLRFTHALSASPWTLPSHMTMMTGLWPTEHQIIEDDRRLTSSVPVIAERLQSAGYATAGFVSAIYVGADYGFNRGFDTYNDFGLTERASIGHAVRTPELATAALDWAKALPPGEPAFLFLHTYDVHYPYDPPEPWNERYNRVMSERELGYRTWHHYVKKPVRKDRMKGLIAQYDESIRYVDDSLEPLIDTWQWDRDVVFIILADHGEEFGERGSWGHAHTLYSEALDIPLIVSGTGIPAAVRDDRVGNIDIAATIAGIAGIPWGIGDGVDVRQPVPDRPFFSETSRFQSNKLGIVDGPANAATACVVDLAADQREQFDLAADPREKTPSAVRCDPLEKRIYDHLGEPWTIPLGALTTPGALFQRGLRLGGVAGPGAFGLWPPDAALTVTLDGVGYPPVSGTLGFVPGPLQWSGVQTAEPRALTADLKAQLEALGYSGD